jgi:hypothetical protein
LIASSARESSPPEAILRSGRGSSPRLAAMRNSTRSMPVGLSRAPSTARSLDPGVTWATSTTTRAPPMLSDASSRADGRAEPPAAARRAARAPAPSPAPPPARTPPPLELGHPRLALLQRRELVAHLRAKRQHLLHGAAVLALEPPESFCIGLRARLRRSGSARTRAAVAPELARGLLHERAGLVDELVRAAERRVDLGELAELVGHPPSSSSTAPSRA